MTHRIQKLDQVCATRESLVPGSFFCEPAFFSLHYTKLQSLVCDAVCGPGCTWSWSGIYSPNVYVIPSVFQTLPYAYTLSIVFLTLELRDHGLLHHRKTCTPVLRPPCVLISSSWCIAASFLTPLCHQRK